MEENTTKDRIIELLLGTEREGIESLIQYMDDGGFFTSPASTRFHGCWAGGLADHSLRVWQLTSVYDSTLRLGVDDDSISIAALTHDLCKMGAYLGDEKPYKWNRKQPSGHASLSLERVWNHIDLTVLEEKMIRYHMGVYGLTEFDEKKGEYVLRGGSMANAWYHHPIVKVMYFCDEIATLEEKTKENK